jgi:cellulose synthase (UDP-forming)
MDGERVFVGWDYAVFGLLTALQVAALAQFLAYWFPHADRLHHPVAYLLLSLNLLIWIGMYEVRWLVLPLMRRPARTVAHPGWRVGVATTFVPGAEPLEMLEETLTALVAMEYPHETWVLDEGGDERVRALCDRLGAHHFSRAGIEPYQAESGRFEARSKHGNYTAWLDDVGFDRYELVVAFDPDHVPDPDYLLNVLGYFDEPDVGYVQAAQCYYNQRASFIARGAAEETYAYYSSIQMASHAIGYPIVTGCHNAHRVTALREAGGFAPHEADDLLLTLYYRSRGWRGVYLPRRLAVGITPVDWHGYLTQQRRWARSVLDVKLRAFFGVASRLSPAQRVFAFMQGLHYLQALATAAGVAVLCAMLATGSAPAAFSTRALPRFGLLFLAVLACEAYRQRFFLHPQERGLHLRGALVRFAKWPWVLAAIRDVLSPRRGPYTITPKVAGAHGPSVWRPHVAVASLVAGAWAVGMLRGGIHNPVLHLSAALVVALSLLVASTARARFAAPYERGLRLRGARERRPGAAPVGDPEAPGVVT